ncbi:MAG: hypothetical protein ACFFE8_14890 [Candidatus Heimdallarchaeota archaeon]
MFYHPLNEGYFYEVRRFLEKIINHDPSPPNSFSDFKQLIEMFNSKSSELNMVAMMVFLGFIMTLGMVTTTVIYPDGGQFHLAMDPSDIYAQLSAMSLSERDIMLGGIVFDTFFILGYLSLFYGLFLLVRHQGIFFPRLGLSLGLATAVCDLIENALHIAFITGAFNDWNADPILWVYLWAFTFTKDLTSYMAGIINVVLLLVTFSSPVNLRVTKLIFIIFFAFYILVGSLGVINPSFLLIRNLGFVIDLGISAILFYRASKMEIPTSSIL